MSHDPKGKAIPAYPITLDKLEEAYAAAEQRDRLEAVYAFLEEHDASDELLDAVEEALVDLEMWLDDELLARAQSAGSSVM